MLRVSLSGRATPYTSVDEINDFAKLKEVAEDMQAHKSELGIEGVFASTSFAPGENWRWQTHLLNIPMYYEFKDKGVSDSDTFDFTYSDNYKNKYPEITLTYSPIIIICKKL